MKSHPIFSIILFGALASPPLAGAVPGPAPEQVSQPHSRVLAISPEALFPKVIQTLLDNDCIVLSANQSLGLIAFSSRSEAKSGKYRRMINHLEGTLLIQPASSATSVVRAKLQLSWHELIEPSPDGYGVQKDADPGWYKGLLDTLEKACVPATGSK